MMISYKLLESQWLMIYIFVCPTTTFTWKVILGTTNGQLYEIAIEEKNKKEKYVKLLFEITEAPVPFIGVYVTIVWTKCIPSLLVITEKRMFDKSVSRIADTHCASM